MRRTTGEMTGNCFALTLRCYEISDRMWLLFLFSSFQFCARCDVLSVVSVRLFPGMSMKVLIDFTVATGVAVIFLSLTWVTGRLLSGGAPLNHFKQTVLLYGFIFVLG